MLLPQGLMPCNNPTWINKHRKTLRKAQDMGAVQCFDDGTQIDLMDYITDGKAKRKSWVSLQENPKIHCQDLDQHPTLHLTLTI
jgi:hypothetical protein